MGLAQVKKFGYGMDGKTLDLVIALPKGSYLKHFWIANQNDIHADNSTRVGIEYIQAVRNVGGVNMSTRAAFGRLFTYKGDFTCKETGNTYALYELNQMCAWDAKEQQASGVGIRVSQNDLNFITMECSFASDDKTPAYGQVPDTFKVPTECGEDNVITVFPMYNLLAIRLRALSYAKFIGCSCEMPRDFIDKILQIKAIELANQSTEYYKASMYWNKFYKGKNIVTNKRCDCHG